MRVERKIVNLDCPPCKHPVKIECFGKHEIGEFACHETRPYSCGSKCGQTLKCSKHKCEFLCHKVDHNCEECERPCEEKRPEGCIHECPNGFCHKDECRPCASLLKFRCNCDKNTIHVECNKWTNANKQEKETLKSCRVPCTKNVSYELDFLNLTITISYVYRKHVVILVTNFVTWVHVISKINVKLK